MVDRGEQRPDKETIAAREALEKGVLELFRSRGVDPKKALSRGSAEIKLIFDEDSRLEIPLNLSSFVKEQYHGRSVGIDEISVVFGYASDKTGVEARHPRPVGGIDIQVAHLYPRTPAEIESEKRAMIVARDKYVGLGVVENITKLEHRRDWHGFIIPEMDLVLRNSLFIHCWDTPMKLSVGSYPVKEWLEVGEKGEASDVPSEIMRRIIDPEGILEFHGVKLLTPQILEGAVRPDVVSTIARMIPDLPNGQSLRTEKFFGHQFKMPVSQPKRLITLQ